MAGNSWRLRLASSFLRFGTVLAEVLICSIARILEEGRRLEVLAEVWS